MNIKSILLRYIAEDQLAQVEQEASEREHGGIHALSHALETLREADAAGFTLGLAEFEIILINGIEIILLTVASRVVDEDLLVKYVEDIRKLAESADDTTPTDE